MKSEREVLDLSAFCAFFLTLNLGLMNISQPYVHLIQLNVWLETITLILCMVAISGTLYLHFKMLRHCFKNRMIPIFLRVVLLPLFFIFIWATSFLYYFLVYRRVAQVSIVRPGIDLRLRGPRL